LAAIGNINAEDPLEFVGNAPKSFKSGFSGIENTILDIVNVD
jgi:hypothetical protein